MLRHFLWAVAVGSKWCVWAVTVLMWAGSAAPMCAVTTAMLVVTVSAWAIVAAWALKGVFGPA